MLKLFMLGLRRIVMEIVFNCIFCITASLYIKEISNMEIF